MNIAIVLLLALAPSLTGAQQAPLPAVELIDQKLDPTGGQILKPRDWFYKSRSNATGLDWSLSSEDPSKGPYSTGFSIQLVIKARETVKQDLEPYCKSFLEWKQKSTKLVTLFPLTKGISNQGGFTRQGIEVVEQGTGNRSGKLYHCTYSMMWSTSFDMIVITVFETPEEQWSSLKQVQQAMSQFELFGADFLKKK